MWICNFNHIETTFISNHICWMYEFDAVLNIPMSESHWHAIQQCYLKCIWWAQKWASIWNYMEIIKWHSSDWFVCLLVMYACMAAGPIGAIMFWLLDANMTLELHIIEYLWRDNILLSIANIPMNQLTDRSASPVRCNVQRTVWYVARGATIPLFTLYIYLCKFRAYIMCVSYLIIYFIVTIIFILFWLAYRFH